MTESPSPEPSPENQNSKRSDTSTPQGGPVQATLESLLGSLEAQELRVLNESHNHSVKPGSESHFRLLIVSDQFEGKNRLARHRQIHKLLAKELAGPVHALTLEVFTPAEWADRGETIGQSPDCRGGSKLEAP